MNRMVVYARVAGLGRVVMSQVRQGLPKPPSHPIVRLAVGILIVGTLIVPAGIAIEGLSLEPTEPSSALAATSTPIAERQPPRFSGVTTHLDPLDRFSIRYPSDWYLEVDEGDGGSEGEQDGITFRPSPEDPETFFSVRVRELGQSVVAGDIRGIRADVEEELGQLPGIKVEGFSEDLIDNLIRFEVVYSFRQGSQGTGVGGSILKRKTWIFYGGRWQYTLTWQGSSLEEYEYWLAMANYSFAFFQLPPSLWIATDRDSIAH